MVNRHPAPDLLVEYTSGSLPLAPSVSVTAHLKFCASCSRAVESLNHVGGEILGEVKAEPVSPGLLEKVLRSIDEDVVEAEPAPGAEHRSVDPIGESLPRYVRHLLPEGKLRWRFLSPSLRLATISVGESEHELALHRIQAGGKAPEHDHTGQEITVVLTGSFSDEDGVYRAGDFIVREPGEVHRPLAAQHEECICLSVLAAPIRLTGLKRVFNPFLGFSPS